MIKLTPRGGGGEEGDVVRKTKFCGLIHEKMSIVNPKFWSFFRHLL